MTGETPTNSLDPAEHLRAGNAHHQAGRLPQAIAAFRRAIQLRPNYSEAFTHLGIALHHGEQSELAMQAFEKAVVLDPTSPAALNNLGRALRLAGRGEEAIEAYKKSLALRPFAPQVHLNLAAAFLDRGRTQEAIDACQHAIQLDSRHVSAYTGLGNAMQACGRFEQAIAAYQHALDLLPDSAQACNNLGNALRDSGRVDEAIECYRRAMGMDGKLTRAHSNLLATLHFLPHLEPETIFREYRHWNELHALPLHDPVHVHANDCQPDRRLRIGYVSPDLREHPVARFFVGLIEEHDASQVEVFCYADLRGGPDTITGNIRAHTHGWRNISGLANHRVAQMIRADKIDILVDLAGHTAGNRLLLFARKPAPVQITYLGYPNTTGLDSIDYCLTDSFLDPPGTTESLYSEQLVRLPHTFACYRPPEGAPEIGPLPVTKNGYVTFASFNNLAKLNAGVIASWATILRQTPGARLRLVAKGLEEEAIAVRLREAFKSHDVDPQRLDLLGFQTVQQYLSGHNEVDLALDPFPVNGHTTTCNALWMGVPVVVLAGATHCSRLGVSVLNNVGLPELVAEDQARYVQIAVALAKDVSRLQELRSGLRDRLRGSVLMDAAQFARDIESAYRWMWRQWCERRSNAHEKPSAGLKGPEWLEQSLKAAEQHLNRGQLEEARAVCDEILAIHPRHAKALFFLGMVFFKRDDPQQAMTHIDESLSIDPDDSGVIYHKAAVLLRLNQHRQALPILEELVALYPDHAGAYSQLGLALHKLGRREEAIAAFDQAATKGVDQAVYQRNLAKALLRCGLHDRAVDAARRAVATRPRWHEPYLYLGQALSATARRAEATDAFRSAMALKPDWYIPHSNLAYSMHFDPDCDARAIHEEHRRWNQSFAEPLRKHMLPHSNDRNPDRRLKIGYVSPNFRDHVIGRNLLPIFRHHDHGRFEIIFYADPARPDSITQKFRDCADQWHDVLGMSHEKLAERIRLDEIDILVDLNLHLSEARLLVFARKPAPVQMTFAGYPASTGLTAIDFRLTDPYLDPPGMNDAFYSEKSIRLPDSFWCYDPMGDDPPVNPLPADKNDYITFGCLNNFLKVNEVALATWSAVLHAMPGSRLMLIAPEGRARSYVLEHLKVDPQRVEFLGRQPHVNYMQTYHRIDISLDTYPYNSHTTGLDSMWMGVPVVSRYGQTAVSRAGLSQATNVGLTELVTDRPDQFVKIALELASDLPRLRHLRATLRERMQKSVLADHRLFARNLEEVYRSIWRQWCETGD